MLIGSLMLASFTGAPSGEAQRSGPKRPSRAFAECAPTFPLDYADTEAWAALPSLEDTADVVPAGAADLQDTAAADVFFVHPTTYLRGDVWNANPTDPGVKELTDVSAIRNQASIFNSAGRVYAPRYRQAILYAYQHDNQDCLKAREFAYADVLVAFDGFLERFNEGRPILLVGHSQGAYHALRLLEERFARTPLAERLVAAYLVGAPIPSDKLVRTLSGIPLCARAQQTGCLLSWNTVATWADRRRFGEVWNHYPTGWESNAGKSLLCSNPLAWSPPRDRDSHDAVAVSNSGPLRRTFGPQTAECVDGLLEISDPRGPAFRLTSGRKGNYHVYDLPLFHMNVRADAERRARAFVEAIEEGTP